MEKDLNSDDHEKSEQTLRQMLSALWDKFQGTKPGGAALAAKKLKGRKEQIEEQLEGE